MKTKAAPKKKAPVSVESLQKRCDGLKKERDRLRKELAKVSAESESYRRAAMHLMPMEKIEFDEEAALAQVGKGQPIEELIAELAAEVSGQCRPRKRRRTT
jgi:predicted transcriptional regulator